jgi:hypothetical protein
MAVTRAEFRWMALSFPETEEREHMNHPDFRVCGKIFATLHYPDKNWGMLKFTPEQQKRYMAEEAQTFDPCAGVWGRRGATNVRLRAVKKATLRAAREAAWKNIAPKRLVMKFEGYQ